MKVGHPNFRPFRVNQKVIREIPRMGDRSVYKLMKKYDGPYIVRKLQSNGVSYEISKCDDDATIYKCHHRKLREFRELPANIQRYVKEQREDAPNSRQEEVDERTNYWIPLALNTKSDESEESEFEGFPSESLKTRSEEFPTSKETTKEKASSEEGRILLKTPKVTKKTVTLKDLPCSEPTLSLIHI